MIQEMNSWASRMSFIKNFLLFREVEASSFDIRIFFRQPYAIKLNSYTS